jgi:hypothetical protein
LGGIVVFNNGFRSSLLALGAFAALTLCVFAPTDLIGQTNKGEKNERHPHIRAAIRELREAKTELESAAHDFGGHRVQAVKDIDATVKQLEKALKFDRK